ncbi:MAG TPA: YdeI/OmpD-associated family protein [Lysobacter sp.]
MTTLPTDLPIKLFKTQAAWEKWLAANGDAPGAWLKIAKKDTGATSVSYSQALDVALCHGWIDGLKRSCDAQYFLQRFTPRKAKSLWSKLNIARVEKLVAAGRMQAAGAREVEAAKADGRWNAAYDAASAMEVPPELDAALKKSAKARKAFEALDRTNRYAFCWRVHTAM